MDDDPIRSYRRWQALEDEGRDDEADRTFDAVFKAGIPNLAPSRDFTAQTMAAVAAAAERDTLRARRLRIVALMAGTAASVVAVYFGAGYAFTAMSAVLVRLIDLLIVGVVYVASVMQSGADVWSVAASIGRATAAVAGDPRVAVALIMIQGVAIAAFVALRRLLQSDVEILK
jgi:hypothetical protein